MTSLQLNRVPSLVTIFAQNNELSTIDGIEMLANLRDLVLDRNRVKAVGESSFIGQGKLTELHMEENRLRDLSNFYHLRNLRRLFLGGNKLQTVSELEKIADLRKLTEVSFVNNPVSFLSYYFFFRYNFFCNLKQFTRKNVHRAILVYLFSHIGVIDGMPVSDEDQLRAESIRNQEEGQGLPGAMMMPTSIGTYATGSVITPNTGILPVHVYQPIGLPSSQQVASSQSSGSNASNGTLLFYQPNYPQQSQQAIMNNYLLQNANYQQQQASGSSNPQIKVSNLHFGLTNKPQVDDQGKYILPSAD